MTGRVGLSILLLSLAYGLVGIAAPGRAQTEAAGEITPWDIGTPNPWPDVPGKIDLTAKVVDQQGEPVQGAKIWIGGRRVATSNSQGLFSPSAKVKPSDNVKVTHADFAPRHVAAGDLYEGFERAIIDLFPYTAEFSISPLGGTYENSGISLTVPKGAVNTSTTVKAAFLPLDLAYDDSVDPQYNRLAALELSPNGQQFNKPITIKVPRAYGTGSVEAVGIVYNSKTRRFEDDPSIQISADEDTVSFTLDHFSTHAAGNKARRTTKKKIYRGTDFNGDGQLGPHDAEVTLLLSGGTQSLEAKITVQENTTVVETTTNTQSSSSSSGSSTSFGMSYGPASYNTSRSVNKEKSKELFQKTGLNRSQTVSKSRTMKLAANEYETKCKMLVTYQDIYRIVEWEEASPNAEEMAKINKAHAQHGSNDGSWSYYNWNRGTATTSGRTMQGQARFSARKTKGGLEVLEAKRTFYVIEKFASKQVNCNAGDIQGRVKQTTGGANDIGTSIGAMKDKFKYDTKGDPAKGNEGWGADTSQSWQVIDMECGNDQEGDYNISFESTSEGEEGESEGEAKTDSANQTAGASGSYGGVGASGEVGRSQSTGSSSGTSKSSGKAKQKGLSVDIHWHIIDAHDFHYSDHYLAPVKIKEPYGSFSAGFMIIRYAERSCKGTPQPEEPETPHTDPPRPTFTPSPNVTPPAPDRKSVDDPPTGTTSSEPDIDVPTDEDTPEGESTQEPGAPPDDRTQADMDTAPTQSDVKFKSLQGQTNVNAERTGTPVTVTASDLDGKPLPVEVETDERTVKIVAKAPSNPANIKVVGHRGMTTLRSQFIPEDVTPRPLAPSDGMVETVNGAVNETLSTPPGTTNMTAPPASHSVTLGDTPVDVVATRPNEIAIAGGDVAPPPSGTLPVTIISPGGDTTSGDVPAWGYRLGASSVTQVNMWAPIYFQCTGLNDEDIIDIKFVPTGGQIIEPSEVSVTCGSASDIAEIAKYQTPQVGPQVFNALVQRRVDN